MVSYGVVINALAKAGKFEGAHRWLQELADSSSGPPNAICFNIVTLARRSLALSR